MTILDVSGVAISFGGVQALDGVSFSVNEGMIFSIIGPNGAGKTTLFNVISGTYRADSGQVHLAGEEITALPPFRRSALGIQRTFQNLQLFESMTALENVMVGRHLKQTTGVVAALFGLGSVARESDGAQRRARTLLEMVGLDHVRNARAGDLAYGQQKRLELARALAAEPRLILLDEPAAGLNAAETEDLAGIIRDMARGGTALVLVEHDMRLVMDISDEVLVLNFGRELARGTPDEMAGNPDVIEAYLGAEVDE